ncbi:MAG: restriction endonuclease, partial [Paraclostridium sp.]
RINAMGGIEFEQFMAFILRFKGYKVVVTQASHDGGVDLILNDAIIVECKRYGMNTRIGSPIINKLVGATVINGKSSCILLTTGELTNDAKSVFANAVKHFDIKLWDYDYIMKLVNEVDQNKVMKYLKV